MCGAVSPACSVTYFILFYFLTVTRNEGSGNQATLHKSQMPRCMESSWLASLSSLRLLLLLMLLLLPLPLLSLLLPPPPSRLRIFELFPVLLVILLTWFIAWLLTITAAAAAGCASWNCSLCCWVFY
jgi:hypothetical protein